MPRALSKEDRTAWELFDADWGSSSGGIDGYLGRVLARCSEWFCADGVTLFLQLEGSDMFLLASQAGIDADLPWSASFRLGESIAGRVAESGEPMLVGDLKEYPTIHPPKGRRKIKSAMIAPLKTLQGECIGVINVSRGRKSRPYTNQDVRRLSQLAMHIALAVANARLFAKLTATVQKHRALASQTANIVQSLHSGVLAVDAGGRVVVSNSEALRLLHARRSAVGLKLETVCRKAPAALGPAIERCAADASQGRRRREVVSDADAVHHYTVSASPVPGAGATILIEDISSQVEAEREISRMRRLAEIGQMTAAIAHEIRNPLTSIRAAAQVIHSERSLANALKWAEIIEQEALSLNDLCDQFLEFARPMSVEPEATDLNMLLARLIGIHEPEMNAAGTTIRFKPATDLPIMQVDADRLTQALRNLLRNAQEAMPLGGEIVVETARRNGLGTISILDDGVGIAPNDLPKLFTPFYTTKSSGTGLGLCNVLRVVEAHGGRVKAGLRNERGSVFTIELPCPRNGKKKI